MVWDGLGWFGIWNSQLERCCGQLGVGPLGKEIPWNPFHHSLVRLKRSTLHVSAQIKPTSIYYSTGTLAKELSLKKTSDCNCNHAISHFPGEKTNWFSKTLEIRFLLLTKSIEQLLQNASLHSNHWHFPFTIDTKTTYMFRNLPGISKWLDRNEIWLKFLGYKNCVMDTATARFPRANLSRYSQHLGRHKCKPGSSKGCVSWMIKGAYTPPSLRLQTAPELEDVGIYTFTWDFLSCLIHIFILSDLFVYISHFFFPLSYPILSNFGYQPICLSIYLSI